ncbi:hypothetical protein GCM10027184_27810 [Saccharothrix stipae]
MVVLPDPFAPRNPVMRPGRTSKDTSSRTRWSPKLRLTDVTVNMPQRYAAGASATSGARSTAGVILAEDTGQARPGSTIPCS